ncbi:MAG: ribbon-helix-helix domain-containing protein [Undibacterium sp.]|uniref:ribbon-helix-helix domain-containing protein n=1 Tax=Undibacterium sp. TaxID=1914977 RepID=UPI0027246E6A|nr:ribbon-helix-helix domain-containing protein [Undibacterium sp.]MDO8650786.1 ribbon-helix-helix domain-containing protein [Undibacterium sp.]
MCDIFVKADPSLYQAKARSIRLHGVVTSIRLEKLFWQVLQEVAERDGMNTNQLITKLYDELIAYRGEIDNFSSFLRVCCLRYLSLMVDGDISHDKRLPLAGLHDGQNKPQGNSPSYLL